MYRVGRTANSRVAAAVIVAVVLSIAPAWVEPALADTATYTFVGVATNNDGTGGNPIAYEHDSDQFPWQASGDQNNSPNPSNNEYEDIAANDSDRWRTADPGNGDIEVTHFRFYLTQTLDSITDVQIRWIGYTENQTSDHTMWVLKTGASEFGGASSWDQLGSAQSITADTDYDFIRNISSGFSTYIHSSTGAIDFAVAGSAVSERMQVNYVEVVVTYTVPESEGIPPPPGTGIPRAATFSGRAYPGSTIELLRRSADNDFVKIGAENTEITYEGNFTITHTGLSDDDFFFALRATDQDGRQTGIVSFIVDLGTGNQLSVTDILMPPTVGLTATAVTQGEQLVVTGYGSLNNTIELQIDETLFVTLPIDRYGVYFLATTTDQFALGTHYVQARQVDRTGPTSSFSFPQAFQISQLKNPQADFNRDGKIDISDWSILLYRWGSSDQSLRNQIDLDGNGVVDIADLSIFLKNMVL